MLFGVQLHLSIANIFFLLAVPFFIENGIILEIKKRIVLYKSVKNCENIVPTIFIEFNIS
jgi:hypothetical protein